MIEVQKSVFVELEFFNYFVYARGIIEIPIDDDVTRNDVKCLKICN